jgi:hypothetical protein
MIRMAGVEGLAFARRDRQVLDALVPDGERPKGKLRE